MNNTYTRRAMLATAGMGLLGTAACTSVAGSAERGQRIDQRADAALDFLYNNVSGARELGNNAAGILVMPLVTEAGLWVGGSYGRGVLRIGGATVDYYSAASGSFGFQIGAQQYAHVLFFMTDDALQRFRASSGFSVGSDLEYALTNRGGALTADTTTVTEPVIAVIFGQAGLIAGATLEGTKYTRIYP